MFRPINSLTKPTNPEFNKINKYSDRWNTIEGERCYKIIIDEIKKGSGDFLKFTFESQCLGSVMEDSTDLRGIEIHGLDVEFSENDNFKGHNFSFAKIMSSVFKKATFGHTYFALGEFSNFEFENCLFWYTNFYGVKFYKTKFKNCTFWETNSFYNCEFIDCEFDNFFTSDNIFTDCCFDVNTKLKNILSKSTDKPKAEFDKKNLPNIYKGIKEAYLSGQVFDKYREYFFNQKSSETRHSKTGLYKVGSYVLENLTGYGVRPTTVLCFMLAIVFSFTVIYLLNYPLSKSVVMSMSAFTTVGDIPVLFPYNIFYVLESGIGISSFALLITVLANVWFIEK